MNDPSPQAGAAALRGLVGSMDIYLLDQVLRGRIQPGDRIFDAGCGHGRNLSYFLQSGHPIGAVDSDAEAVSSLRSQVLKHFGAEGETRFDVRSESIEESSFPDDWADIVICNAVLHFARNEEHFRRMVEGCWRVLRVGGIFFSRLTSTIGMDRSQFRPLGQGRFVLPDGSERFLVDEKTLQDFTESLGGVFLDPLKTTVVANARCMTTWVVSKSSS